MDFYLTTSASPFPCFQITWLSVHVICANIVAFQIVDIKTELSAGTSVVYIILFIFIPITPKLLKT